MTEMQGTPITRGGGYLIRVGWRVVGYSVDKATDSMYRRVRAVLRVLAILVAVIVANVVIYVFFTFIAPLAVKVGIHVNYHPEIWKFVIYWLTLVVGTVSYMQIMAMVGKNMVAGQTPFDKGYSFGQRLEKRRQHAGTSLFRLIAGFAGIAVTVYFIMPVTGLSLGLFIISLLILAIGEGLFFRLYYRPEVQPVAQRKRRAGRLDS